MAPKIPARNQPEATRKTASLMEMTSLLRPEKNKPRPTARVIATESAKPLRLFESESIAAQMIEVAMAAPIIISNMPESLATVRQFI